MTFEAPPPPPAFPLPPPPPAPYVAAPVRRSKASRVGVGVGLVALVGVVASLTVALTGSGAGATSPEAAVREFTGAVSDEDVVAAVLTMAPTEVGSAHELYEPLIELLVRNGQLGPEGNPLAGVDIEITDLQLETEMLHDDIGKVSLRGGKVTLDVKVDELDPVLRDQGAPAEDIHEEFDIAEIEASLDDANAMIDDFGAEAGVGGGAISSAFLMTVREDGRWYVSPTYTIVEYAREALGVPLPEFGAWREQVGPGADSPSAVLESFVSALSALDSATLAESLESGLTLPELEVQGALAPGEFAAFFDYAPVFQAWIEETMGGGWSTGSPDELNAQLAEMLRDVEFDVTASANASENRIDDDRVKVVLDSATFELTGSGIFEGEAVSADVVVEIYDGVCGSVLADVRSGPSMETIDESGCADDVLPGADFDGFFIVTVERDGAWYFSPTETLVQYLRLAIDSELAK